MLFECLTGRAAFEGMTPMAVLAKIVLQETPRVRDVRPELPEALDALVARMMAKAPGERPADTEAMARELDALDDINLGPPTSAQANAGPAPTLAAASDRAPFSISITRNESAPRHGRVRRRARRRDGAEAPRAQLEAALDAYGGQLIELPGRSLVVTQWGAGQRDRPRGARGAVRADAAGAPVRRLHLRRHRAWARLGARG